MKANKTRAFIETDLELIKIAYGDSHVKQHREMLKELKKIERLSKIGEAYIYISENYFLDTIEDGLNMNDIDSVLEWFENKGDINNV